MKIKKELSMTIITNYMIKVMLKTHKKFGYKMQF